MLQASGGGKSGQAERLSKAQPALSTAVAVSTVIDLKGLCSESGKNVSSEQKNSSRAKTAPATTSTGEQAAPRVR